MSLRAEAEAILHDRSKVIDTNAEQLRRFAAAYLELVRDRERLEWSILHSSATVMVNRGQYAVYFGPQPSTKWFSTPREAIDSAMTVHS